MMTVSSKQAGYQDRLDRVVTYIYDHVDEAVTVDRLAEVACFSAYHWHRIYTAMRGETIAATVKRSRLQRAADRLANSDMPIKDIAARAGYSAVESFGRAFKEVYQRSPADYRTRGSHAKFKAANAAGDTSCFNVVVEHLPMVRCASVAHRGSYMRIGRAMGKLFSSLADQTLLTQDSRMIGVFFDDPDVVPESELRSMACSPVAEQAELAAPLEVISLHEGAYAKLRYQGPYADMKEAYRWLFGVWRVTRGRLLHHPRGDAGDRAIGSRNEDHRSTVAFNLANDEDGLTALRMKRIIDPPFDGVIFGSMSLFRAVHGGGWPIDPDA